MWGVFANIATDTDFALYGVPCTATLSGVTTSFTGNYSARTRRKTVDAQTGMEYTTWDPTLICRVSDLPPGGPQAYMAITVQPQTNAGGYGDPISYEVAEVEETDIGTVRLVLSGRGGGA